MESNKSRAIRKLKKDYKLLQKRPISSITAEPLPENWFEWHFVLKGPVNSPYEGGYYHCKLKFPDDYPIKPPMVIMITPNGRFQTNTRIDMNMTDLNSFWGSSWPIASFFIEFIHFMLDTSTAKDQMQSTDEVKRDLALKSLAYNVRNTTFCDLFPDIALDITDQLKYLNELMKTSKNTSEKYPIQANMLKHHIKIKKDAELNKAKERSNPFYLYDIGANVVFVITCAGTIWILFTVLYEIFNHFKS